MAKLNERGQVVTDVRPGDSVYVEGRSCGERCHCEELLGTEGARRVHRRGRATVLDVREASNPIMFPVGIVRVRFPNGDEWTVDGLRLRDPRATTEVS